MNIVRDKDLTKKEHPYTTGFHWGRKDLDVLRFTSLVTRSRSSREYLVEIDWNSLIEKPFLDEAPVKIIARRPEVFTRNRTGTRIEIRELRETTWTRGKVRRLHNQITSICSPFQESGSFNAVLEVPGHETWTSDLPDISEILNRAIWKFSFRLDRRGKFDWHYEFRQVPGFNLDSRTVKKSDDSLKLPPESGDDRMTENLYWD